MDTDAAGRQTAREIVLRIFTRLPIPLRRRIVWLAVSKFTVGVSGVVVDAEGRVLLMRHRARESIGWELPGGFLERRESPEAALRRELREEAGLEVTIERIVTVTVPRVDHLDVCFLAHLSGGRMERDAGEVLDARFFALEELASVLRADQRDSVRRAFDAAGDSSPF